jgi:hypothetical protein
MEEAKLNYDHSLPDATQTLLLKACLCESKEESIIVWSNWIASKKNNKLVFSKTTRLLPQVFDNLDFGSQRLLSLLYKKMTLAKVTDPFIDELKGYYRYIWARNQVLRNQLEEIVILFNSRDVRHIIIKGFPKIEKFYKDWGVRSVFDIDIVIHAQDWTKAIDVLRENQWIAKHANLKPEWIANSLHHAYSLEKNSNELDLHIRFTHFPLNEETENKFWNEARFYKDHHLMLKPEHQLICSFAHGIQGKDEAMRTITDTVYIIRNTLIDWNEVVDVAHSCNLLVPTRAFIEYLNKEGFVKIQGKAIDKLKTLSPSAFELDYFKLILTPTPSNGFKQFRLNFLHTSALESSFRKRIHLLLNTYRFQWGIKSVTGIFLASLWVLCHKVIFPKERIESRKIPFLSMKSKA